MARDVPNAGGAELSNTGATPVTAAPFTMACWFNNDDATLDRALMSLRDSTGNNRFTLQVTGSALGDPVSVTSTAGGVAVGTDTATGFTTGTWHHACAVFASSTSRSVYIDGGSKGTSVTSSTPTNIDRVRNAVVYDGKIAEAAIWNVALTDVEVALLAEGVSPKMVRPDALVSYWPLIGRYSPEIDVVGGINLTITGTVPAAAHPRIYYPTGPLFAPPTAKAFITGTATAGITEADVVAGGKEIIITLRGDEWVASGATFDAQRQNIIDGLDSAQVEATGWNAEVRDNLAVTDVVRTSDTVVTITLSAQAAYDITATETITVTVPSTAVLGGVAITGIPTFNVLIIGDIVATHFVNPDNFRRESKAQARRRKAPLSTVYAFNEVLRVAPPWIQADSLKRPRITHRRLASIMSTVYSLPRDHAVFIDPIVIEFTVVDPQVRRTGGWVAGSDMVRPIGAKTVRPVD